MKKYKIFKYIGPYKKDFIIAICCFAFETLLEISIPFLMNELLSKGVYIDNVTNKYAINVQNLTIISLIMVVCAVLAFFLGVNGAKYTALAGRGFGAELRKNEYLKIQKFSFNNIDTLRTSSLITRLTDDITVIQDGFCECMRPIIRAPLTLIFSLVFAFIISPILALIFCVSLPVLAVLLLIILFKVKPNYKKMQMAMDDINRVTNENITNIKTIKSFVKEDYEIEKFDEVNKNFKHIARKSFGFTALNMPTVNLIMYATIVCILYFGGIFVINEQYGVTTVNISSFLTYVQQILASLTMMSNVFMIFNRMEASIDRTKEVLTTDINYVINKDSKLKIEDGNISFKNVCFKYNQSANKNTLENINLNIKKGQFIGIVGKTGSGKTTLINLIDRFYDISTGKLLIDNIDIKDFSMEELHSKISLSFQSPLLFKGSVIDNLKFGNKNASMDDVIKACKLTCCYDFITTKLANGFDTIISEGGTDISGGQRQRICLARALIVNPKILILDDSFSAIDHLTEIEVKKNLNSLKNITKIVVSQKISAIKDADKIIVLDEGKITSIGKHEDLLSKDNIYKELATLQNEIGGNK
ncbi:MAG: ABC transporter ATP-binding protein [Bacilli bacterium]